MYTGDMPERSDLPPVRAALKRWALSKTAAFTGTAVLVGLLTGGASIGFVWLIRAATQFFGEVRRALHAVSPLLVVFVPAFGGLGAGLLITYVAEELRYGGIPPVLRSIALQGSRLRARLVWAKPLATAICIGSGGSAGRVGPIVQLGAALGSQVGQRFHLTDERIRNLVACGAAGGIASTFNAPIAGVFFALEVILGEFTETYFATIVISAVTSSIVSRSVLDTEVIFAVPTITQTQPLEIVFHGALGVLAALVAWSFITTFYGTKDLTARLRRVPAPLRPALGGLLLGVLGLAAPQVLGGGFEQIELALEGGLPLALMALLVPLKLLATDLTLGTGSSGGLFAPVLFMGAMLGGAFGELLHLLLPAAALAPSGAYALVGMAAVFSAAAHAPMTALLIIFEMSGSYNLILPLMLAAGISTVVARALQPESVYTLSLARQGLHVRRGQELDVLQHVRVDEVMTPDPVTVELRSRLDALESLIDRTRHRGYPVLDAAGQLAGLVSLQDLTRAQARWDEWEQHTVAEICTHEVVVAYPDEAVAVALQRLGVYDVSRLPVVSRDDPARLVGVVHRSDIGAAYHQALQQREEAHRLQQRQHLEQRTAAEVVDVEISPESPAAGQPIKAIAWPPGCLVVAVHRGDDVLVGRGDVVLRPGDRLTIYAREECGEALQTLLSEAEGQAQEYPNT